MAPRLERAVARAPASASITRWSLGLMLLAAGGHKLLQPEEWVVYVVGWLAPLLLVSPVTFMLINGVLELGFGAALVADRFTAFSAAVAAVSLTATAGYLALVWLTTGEFGDVLARDIGLAGLAWAVLVDTMTGE